MYRDPSSRRKNLPWSEWDTCPDLVSLHSDKDLTLRPYTTEWVVLEQNFRGGPSKQLHHRKSDGFLEGSVSEALKQAGAGSPWWISHANSQVVQARGRVVLYAHPNRPLLVERRDLDLLRRFGLRTSIDHLRYPQITRSKKNI